MKEISIQIATMYEGRSKHGRTFFYGRTDGQDRRTDSGGHFLMTEIKGKRNEKGEKVWNLILSR